MSQIFLAAADSLGPSPGPAWNPVGSPGLVAACTSGRCRHHLLNAICTMQNSPPWLSLPTGLHAGRTFCSSCSHFQPPQMIRGPTPHAAPGPLSTAIPSALLFQLFPPSSLPLLPTRGALHPPALPSLGLSMCVLRPWHESSNRLYQTVHLSLTEWHQGHFSVSSPWPSAMHKASPQQRL